MFAVTLGHGARLRPLEPWRAEEFLAHMDRARATVDPWIPWAGLSTDLASARATLQRYADLQARDSGRLYGIWLDDAPVEGGRREAREQPTGRLVGGTMFVSFDTAAGACEVGCWLEPAATGRGLVTAAVGHLIDWAVRERGIVRVQWLARPDNVRSTNVARRLGMHLDGVLRSAVHHQGARHDLEVWSVLADEWRSPAG